MVNASLFKDAQKNAEEISKWLKENYPGQTVTKASIRSMFELPINRSVAVWEHLRKYGFEIQPHTIIVPAPSQIFSASLTD